MRKGRCCAARNRRRALPLRSWRCACARAPALTKNAHAGEGFSPLLQKSGRCRRGEIALFGIYFAFKARKTFFRYLSLPKRDPALKRENFADSRKSALAGRRSPESLRWFAQDHPVRSGLSRWFLRGAAAHLHRVRGEMMILRK